MDNRTEQAPKPLTWKCDCGWMGLAGQMTLPDYTCPKCGRFDTVRVMLQLKDHPLRAENVAC